MSPPMSRCSGLRRRRRPVRQSLSRWRLVTMYEWGWIVRLSSSKWSHLKWFWCHPGVGGIWNTASREKLPVLQSGRRNISLCRSVRRRQRRSAMTSQKRDARCVEHHHCFSRSFINHQHLKMVTTSFFPSFVYVNILFKSCPTLGCFALCVKLAAWLSNRKKSGYEAVGMSQASWLIALPVMKPSAHKTWP